MKKRFSKKIIISFLLIFVFINNTNTFATNESETLVSEEEQAQLSSSQEEKDKILKEKKKIQNTLKDLKALKNDTEEYIKVLDNNLNALNAEIELINDSLIVKEQDIEITQVQLNEAIKTENRQSADMKKRIQYVYELGEMSYFKMLLSASDVSDYLSRFDYVKEISKYDKDKLQVLKDNRALVEYLSARLLFEKESLLVLKSEQDLKKESIETLINEKTNEISDAEETIALSESELKKLEEEEKKQDEIIKKIEQAIRQRNSSRVLVGGFVWPCPSSTRITSTFGYRTSPTKGASTYHKGIDIGAQTGSNVIAAADGEVVISSYNYSSGNYIMIDHGSDIFTIYMHLSKKSVAEGVEVKQGDVIGLVGSTGISTGPHLHFGVRRGGEYVDPQIFV
ncbi:MAG: peptidoglycan DD-metalloendopeptidase family protein [Eubacteriales bacterium]|nr:peptidoglycan DD-metalloendopeptidase family protein [Eubacteriales bacterium]